MVGHAAYGDSRAGVEEKKKGDPAPSFSYAFGTENSGLLYEVFKEKKTWYVAHRIEKHYHNHTVAKWKVSLLKDRGRL